MSDTRRGQAADCKPAYYGGEIFLHLMISCLGEAGFSAVNSYEWHVLTESLFITCLAHTAIPQFTFALLFQQEREAIISRVYVVTCGVPLQFNTGFHVGDRFNLTNVT